MGEFLSGLGLMSLQAGCVVLVVLAVRFLFTKLRVPKKYAMLLWLVPYLCMICPWKVESAFGFWRQPQEYQLERVNHVLREAEAIVGKMTPESGAANIDVIVDEWQATELAEGMAPSGVPTDEIMKDTTHISGAVLGDASSPLAVVGPNGAAESSVLDSFNGAENVARIVFGVWLVGMLGILSYSVVSYVRLKKKLICSVNLRDNIYIADDIQVPFVLGLVHPKIFLPGGMNKENQLYVLAHESTHIRRRDTIWKFTALLTTAMHWFNPFVWVAWHFMEKDMEMACDEETLQRLGLEQKQAYATALLQLSAGRRFALGAPLAFGEGNVKGRIQNIVKYKKTLGVVSGVAVALVVVLAVVFMSSSSICALQDVEEEWSVFHATDDSVSVVMNGERTEFPPAYCTEFSEFFLELEVARNPISKSRAEDRVKDIVIGFGEERFYYLSEDCTEIWSDNRVKPGYSYRIQNPQEVKDFLERMQGSVAEAEATGAGQGNNKQQNGQEETNKAEQGINDSIENVDEQLSVIAGEKELWLHKYSDYTYFTVTDLDRNGRLELIRSFMEGTGRYTRTAMYEITEDGLGLEEVIIDFARGDSELDIIETEGEVYENEEGVFFYVFQDYIRGGYSEHQYYKHAVKLEKGKLESEVLAEHYEFWDETETTITYKNASGEAITEEEYINAAEKRFAGLNRYRAVFVWKEMAAYENVELIKALEEAWESFELTEDGVAQEEETEPVIEPPSAFLPAFTMEDLIALCEEEMVGETMQNYVWQDGLLPENFEKQQGVEGALTYTYSCLLPYGDKEYRFSASYWKAELAQEYGHAPDQLDMVHLRELETDDLILLYSEEPQYTVNLDIEEFLGREYAIENYMTFELPAGAYLGSYSVSMQDIFEGSLLLGEYEEIQHGEWAPQAWYAPGGVGITGKKMLEELAVFEDGKLVEFHWYDNHLWGEKIETLENCELPAVLYHYEFDVFTLPELDEYARENNMSMDEVDAVSDYWYVFFAEPDGEYVYTIFLNQEYFTKEDIIDLAQSVKIQ